MPRGMRPVAIAENHAPTAAVVIALDRPACRRTAGIASSQRKAIDQRDWRSGSSISRSTG